MEQTDMLDTMGQLKLYGIQAAYDEINATAAQRKLEPKKIVGDLLEVEVSEQQAKSIKYPMAILKLPLAKEIDEFDLEAMPVDETPVRDLTNGGLLEQ